MGCNRTRTNAALASERGRTLNNVETEGVRSAAPCAELGAERRRPGGGHTAGPGGGSPSLRLLLAAGGERGKHPSLPFSLGGLSPQSDAFGEQGRGSNTMLTSKTVPQVNTDDTFKQS